MISDKFVSNESIHLFRKKSMYLIMGQALGLLA